MTMPKQKLALACALLALLAGSAIGSAVKLDLDGKATTPEDLIIPGMMRVQYTPEAALQMQVQKSSNGVAEIGIESLDLIHRAVGVRTVSGLAYVPQNRALAAEIGADRAYVLEFPEDVDVMALSRRLAADPNVESASPVVRMVFAAVPTDPNYAAHWGHNNTAQLPGYDWGGTWDHTLAGVGTVGFDCNAQVGWNSPQGYGSAGVTVAVIDTGVDVDHPDYNYVGGWDFISGDSNPDEASNAHGTACSGIVASTANNGIGSAGAAPNVGIMGLRTNNSTSTESALYYAADNGADVISMSFHFPGWGPGTLPGVEAGLTYAAGADVFMVAATGNDNISTIWTPGNNANVAAVGAASPCGGRKRSSSLSSEVNSGVSTDPNGYTCDGERWWGSSWGANIQNGAAAVDFIAPTILPTTDILGAGGYQPGAYEPFFNGTSCATPYAAGVAALVRSLYPSWTAVQVRAHLRATAIDIADVDAAAGWDRKTGYGMLDMAAALALPDGRPYHSGGWPDHFVLSNVPGTTFGVGAFSAVLPGDGTTYTSWWYANFGTAYLNNPGAAGYRDGVQIYGAGGGNWAPGWTFGNVDMQAVITGGRHTIRTHIDPNNLILELDETNNAYARQFAWTPAPLAPNTMVSRAAPPGGWADSAYLNASGNSTGEFNNDSMGFQPDYGVGFWRAMATHSADNAAAQDYDIGLMNPTSDIFTGNDNASWTGVQSLNPGGILDAVLVNANNDGANYETTLWNQSSTGTASNYVEHRVSKLPEYHADFGGTEVINFAANQMIALREVFSGSQTVVGVNIEVIGASQPVKVAVFDRTFTRGTLANAAATATSNAAGKATINHAMVINDFYGVAIYRNPVDGNAALSVRLTVRGPVNLTVQNTAPTSVSTFNVPNGAGDFGTAAQLFGGGTADATVTALVVNAVTGTAQAGVPASDLRWTVPGMVDCDPLGHPADGPTDAAGMSRWTLPRRSGGWGGSNSFIVLNSPVSNLGGGGPSFRHNSSDINGDLQVNLIDVSTFASDYAGSYNYRSDFFWDGLVNLLDVTRLASSLSVTCGSPKAAEGSALASGGSLGIYFDADGTLGSASVEANRDLTAYVVARGEAARSGISAWEAALELSDNVLVHDAYLGESALNLGEGHDYVVGLGQDLRQSDEEMVVLATLKLRVTDDHPAYVKLAGARGAELPAVVMGLADDGELRSLEVTEATLNDGNGPRVDGDVPFTFVGYQLSNHPNPFNPSTEIHFALPQAGDARVRIFDVAGRLVRELEGGTLSEGAHSLVWNGTDHRGAGVVSGVYYYRLFVDQKPVGTTERMVLVK